MSKNYLIYGVKRTGNHAIINWLMPQIGEVVRFFNDQKYMLKDLTEIDDEHHLVEHILQLHRTRVFVDGELKRRGESFNEEYDNVNNIISFEGIKMSQYFELENQWLRDMNRGIKTINPDLVIGNDNTYIIMLRNPWNIAASQIRWSLDRPNYDRVDVDMDVWDEFYGHYIEQRPNTHFIIFDKWFSDIEYRKKISSDLGLEFSDLNINKVANAGGGSSFTQEKFDGKAQEMNVLNRYKEMMGHERMQKRFLNTDMAIETKNKWNHLCDLENIVELKIK
jgi:hypothetical protein